MFLYFLILLVVLFILSQPLTVLFHELGHAIPLLVFTKKPVVIFIGSYGNTKRSVRLNFRVFDIWLGYNPLKWVWRGGLCISAPVELSNTKQLIYAICGPIASTIVASVCLYFAF